MSLSDNVFGLGAFISSIIWNGPLEESSPGLLFQIFLICRRLEFSAKKRKEEARDRLMRFLELNGEEDENGNVHFKFLEGKATKTRKVRSSPDVEKVVQLLSSKGVEYSSVLIEKQTVDTVVDVSSLEQLVKTGRISQSELNECYNVYFAFNASESKETKKVLADL
jgi:hypothetical protein